MDACAGETAQSLQEQFPTTEIFSHIEIADGRIWMLPDGIKYFAGDLPEQEQKLVWATQGVRQRRQRACSISQRGRVTGGQAARHRGTRALASGNRRVAAARAQIASLQAGQAAGP